MKVPSGIAQPKNPVPLGDTLTAYQKVLPEALGFDMTFTKMLDIVVLLSTHDLYPILDCVITLDHEPQFEH